LSPCLLAILAAVFGLGLSKGRNSDELNIIGNFLAALSGVVLIVQSLAGCQDAQRQDEQDAQYKRDLEKQLTELRQQIKELKNT
jgi:hypothetical protein